MALPARAAEQSLHLPDIPAILSRRRKLLVRVLECVPAVTAITVISSLFWGPLFAPLPFAAAILTFHFFWLLRAQFTGAHAFKGYRLLKRHRNEDWRARHAGEAAADPNVLPWEAVRHIVLIVNYTEPFEKLRACLDSLARQSVASRIVAVLAMEDREGEPARQRAAQAIAEYSSRLGGVLATYHPAGLPGEVVGKSSNENWAARRAKEQLVDLEGGDIDLFTVTSCDVDTVFDDKYFDCLTYSFATHPQRYRRFWQGPIFYYNNIWHVPAPARFPHSVAGLSHLARMSGKMLRNNFPQSTYSLSLRMAHEVGYWDPDIIPEDWHMFLKCYYALNAEVDTETMYTPIYMDGIRSKSYWGTFVSYFQQARRHAWGCTDIPYAVQQVVDHPEIPLGKRLRRLWAVSQSHFLWSTQWFLVTVGRVLPMVMVSLGLADMPDWFKPVSHYLLLPCGGTLVLLLILDAKMRPPRPKQDWPFWLYPFQYAQWFAMAVITFFFSALPALDAQVRLALGKRLEYRVTEKA